MRKLILALILSLPSVCFGANQDQFGGMRPAVWRSSSNCGAHAWGILSTGSIIVHGVAIGSPTVNINTSFIATFNSTTTPHPGNSANFLTTGTLTQAGILSSVSGILNLPTNVYDAYFSSGVVVNKAGASCSTILWDYMNPKMDYHLVPYRP